MNRQRTIIRGLAWMALLAPLAVTATPPTPNPPVHLRIGGQVLRSGGGSPAGIPVALAAACGDAGEWRILAPGSDSRGCRVDGSKGMPLALTDDDGTFILDVYTHSNADSLALAVVGNGTFVMGAPFTRRDTEYVTPVYEDYYHEDEGYLCGDNIEVRQRVVAMEYGFPPDTLVVE